MPEESKASTPRPTLFRTALVVGAAVAAALGGGIAIAANAPAPRQATPAPEAANDFVGIQPVRVLDTRNAAGGPIGISPGHKLGAGESIDVAVAGVGAIPKEATSVAINVTIDEDATLKSFLTVWPTGQARPNTSANNAEPGLVSPNSAIFQLGTGGKLSVFNQQGSVNVIIDVTGYFVPGEFVPTTTTTVPGGTTTTAPGGTTTTTVPTATLTADGAPFTTNQAGVTYSGTGWTGCTNVTVDVVDSANAVVSTSNATITADAINGTFTAPGTTGTYTLVAHSNPATPQCEPTSAAFNVA